MAILKNQQANKKSVLVKEMRQVDRNTDRRERIMVIRELNRKLWVLPVFLLINV